MNFRLTKQRDHKVLSQMLANQWELGRGGAGGAAPANPDQEYGETYYGKIYLYEILSRTDTLITAYDEATNEIMGCGGYCHTPQRSTFKKRHHARLFHRLIAKSPTVPLASARHYSRKSVKMPNGGVGA